MKYLKPTISITTLNGKVQTLELNNRYCQLRFKKAIGNYMLPIRYHLIDFNKNKKMLEDVPWKS